MYLKNCWIHFNSQWIRMYRSSWFKPGSLQRILVFLSTTRLSTQLSTHTRGRTTSLPSSPHQQNKIAWFRNHALRLNDNESLLAAIEECNSETSTIVPVFLWEKHSGDDGSGGTASELFTAHSLKSLSLRLDGKLGIGYVTSKNSNSQQDRDVNQIVDDVALQLVKEIVSICEKNSANEIFYIRSSNVLLEERISNFLTQNGITPRTYGGCSLLDYTKEDVPWKDIILAHSFRSPLIPFVDFVLERLSQTQIQEAIEIPLTRLLTMLGDLESESFSDHINIDHLLQTLGKSSGGTAWGESIVESFPQSDEDAAKDELEKFLHSLKPKSDDEKQTHFTSRLSPFLARGLLSPRQVYNNILSQDDDCDTASFIRRLCWRDYTHAVVSLYPDVLYGRPIRLGYEINSGNLDNQQKHSLDMWKKG